MMMYLDESGQQNYYRDFTQRMTEFMDAVSRPEVCCCALKSARKLSVIVITRLCGVLPSVGA